MIIPVLAGRRRGLLIALIAVGLCQAACAALLAALVHQLFDGAVAPNGGLAGHEALLGGLLAATAMVAILRTGQRPLEEMLGQDFTGELRLALFENAVTDASRAEDGGRDARRLLPFVGDLSAHRRWVGAGIGRLTVGAATSVALLGFIAVQSPLMAVGVGGVQILGGLAMSWLSRPLREANEALRRRRASLASFIGGRLSAAAAVRSMGGMARERVKVERRGREVASASVKRATVSGGARSLAWFTGSLMGLTALVVGVFEISRGEMSLGAVVSMLGLIGLMSAAVSDLGQAFDLWHAAKAATLSVERRLVTTAPSDPAPRRRRSGGSLVALDRLRLSDGDRAFSATLDAGEMVLISETGRHDLQRLVAVLEGAAAPAGGCVRMKGRDLRELGPARLRRRVGVASPALGILRGSLGMNLRYRAGRVDEAELLAAVELCGLTPLVERLAGGLAGDVGDGGSRLNPAERQGLLIARAIIGRPPLLVLDSVDAGLSDRTARTIAETLNDWPGVVVLSAQRPDWRAAAGRTWALGRRGLREVAAAPVAPSPQNQTARETEICLP